MTLKPYQVVAISSWIARIIQAILQIYIIKLLTSLLNVEEYATYTLIMALLGWIVLSDFSISISLQNFISEMRAKNASYNVYIGNAIFLVTFIFVLLFILFYPLSIFLAPEYLIRFDFDIDDKITIFYLAIVTMLLTTISSIVYKIYFAIHQGYISNIMPAIATMLSFFMIYLIVEKYIIIESTYHLLFSILLSLIPQAILPLILIMNYIKKNNINITFDKSISIKIIKRGFDFWIFSILAAITLQVDYIVASQYLSANEIVLYSTLSKLFLLGFFIYNSILAALWPVISEHLHKNEWENVFKYIKLYIPVGFSFIIIFGVILYFVHPFIFQFLIKNTVLSANLTLIISFTLYFIIRVWTDTFAMVLQSINILKPFWIIVPIQAFLSLFLQIIFAKMFGLQGLLFGLIASFLLTVAWYLPYRVKKKYLQVKGI